MKDNHMQQTKKNDGILILVVLVIAIIAGGAFFLTQRNVSDNGTVVVTIDGEEYATYPLGEKIQEKIELPDGSYNMLEIKEGLADITEASCPDKVCVDHHPINKTNQNIVCLPNKVVISIVDGGAPEVDSMTN